MDEHFIFLLNVIRHIVGKPFIVVSGWRCKVYNNKVSITGYDGPHTTGRAVDIRAGSRLRAEIIKIAVSLGISRFGIGSTFIHLDDLADVDGFDADVIWLYY